MNPSQRLLRVKKYANRRYYDSTRSTHVTLAELYDLVAQGYDLEVTDAASNEDITHVVLTQIILERDAPKLAVFPAAILHQLIRTKTQFLGSVVESFVANALQAQRATQEQWSRFWEHAASLPRSAGAPVTTPADWTRLWAELFNPQATGRATPPAPPPQPPDERRAQITELQQQLAALAARLHDLSREES